MGLPTHGRCCGYGEGADAAGQDRGHCTTHDEIVSTLPATPPGQRAGERDLMPVLQLGIGRKPSIHAGR